MVKLSAEEIREIIKPVGLSPMKSKGIYGLSKIIIEKHNGEVPQNYKDLENVHMFYKLAINSGQIGMFHYDLDKHDSSVFKANEIYADIFGMSPNEDGMYKSEDFLRAQLPLEKNISKYESVNIQMDKIIRGEVEGTDDDILKIQNLKTKNPYPSNAYIILSGHTK